MKLLAFLAIFGICAATPAASPASNPPASVVAQVDGVTDAVVDKLWINTDRYWHEGDYYRIMALIRIVGEADPSFAEAYANGAWLLWSMGDVDAAQRFVDRGLENAPAKAKGDLNYEVGYLLFAYKKDYKAALPYLEKAAQYPNMPVVTYTNLAHCYERSGDLGRSAATWRTVVQKFPAFGAGPTNLRRVEAKIKAVDTKA